MARYQVQQEPCGLGEVSRRGVIMHPKMALPIRARCHGDQGAGERRRNAAVDVTGKRPDQMWMAPDHLSESRPIVESHAVQKRQTYRHWRMVQGDDRRGVRSSGQRLVDPRQLFGAEKARRTALDT